MSTVDASRRRLPEPLAGARRRASGLHLPLAVVLAGAVALGLYYVLQVEDWRVMTDELLYRELATNLWGDPLGGPQVRGEAVGVYALLMPALAAPLFGLMSVPDGYQALHVLNVVALVSAAIPAALIARELTDWRPAWWIAGALAGVTPWMPLAVQVMTESIAYPVFVWALYALFVAVARPGPRADVVALVALVLAFLARTQFAVLVVLLPVAIVLHEVGWRLHTGGRLTAFRDGLAAAVRGHLVLVAAGLLALVAVLVGPSAGSLLGNYEATTSGDLLPPGLWATAVDHLGRIAAGIGFVPVFLTAAWLIGALARPQDREEHAFAVLSGLALVALTLVVASFVLRFSDSHQERYLFFIAPVFAIGTVLALTRLRRPLVPMALAALVVGWLVQRNTYTAAEAPTFISPVTNFFAVLEGRAYQLGNLVGVDRLSPRVAIVVVSVAVPAACAVLVRRGWGRVALAVLAVALVGYQAVVARYGLQRSIEQNAFWGNFERERDWVDGRMPNAASVGLVPSWLNMREGQPYWQEAATRIEWWDVDFWNKKVDRAYSFEGLDTHTGALPVRALELDRDTGALAGWHGGDGMILASSMLGFAPHSLGPPVEEREFRLYRVPAEPRAAWAVLDGVGIDGWTEPDRPTRLRLYPDRRETGTLRRVVLTVSASGSPVSNHRFRVIGPGVTSEGTLNAAAGELTALDHSVDVCLPTAAPVDLRLTVPQPFRLDVERRVGLRLLAIRSEPGSRPCPSAKRLD